MMSEGFKTASSSLVHYFRICMEGAELDWTADNQTEIEGIIDDLEEAIYDKLEELKRELRREIEDDLQLKFSK